MNAVAKVQKRQVINPTGERLGYLKARDSVADRGGLPSHILHDEYLVGSEKRYKSVPGYYAAWAREFLVHPPQNAQFQKGTDVVDEFTDNQGRKQVLPGSYVAKAHEIKEVFGIDKVGLFIDPEDVKPENYKGEPAVILHPKSIIVLHGLPQESGGAGKVDKSTGIPLEVDPELWAKLSVEDKRWLYRNAGAGVRALVRDDFGGDFDYGQDVVADYWLGDGYGVAYVDLEAIAPKIEVSKAPSEINGLLVKGVTLEKFRAILTAANANLSELSQTIRPEKLEAMRRLVETLEIKE